MSKTLVLAEKPSVARDYANALKCRNTKDGYIEGSEYIITWAYGHLFTLKEPEEYKEEWKAWNLESLPIVPERMEIKLIDSPSVKKQYKVIKDLIHSPEVTRIVIGTDAGREGELIARYILLAAKNTKPVFRLWLNSMTEKDIIEGFKNLKPAKEYDNVFLAAQARNELDWLLGMNFSRAYTAMNTGKVLLSVGRCQTPVLALICSREEKIKNFKSEPYWEVIGHFSLGYTGKMYQENKVYRLFSKDLAMAIKREIEGQDGMIIKVDKKVKEKEHPLLYNLTNLQRVLNRKYGFKAQEVLDIMQNLYEKHKILSYPRTAARHISESMVEELPEIISCLKFDKFKPFAKEALSLPKLPVTKRLANDEMLTDHTAIIPVKNENMAKIYSQLSEKEKKVFDEVVLIFLAAFFGRHKYEVTEVLTKVGKYEFVTKGSRVLDYGWKKVYDLKDENKEEETTTEFLPELQEGLKTSCKRAEIREDKTKPPARYTEDSLLAVMENPSGLIEDEALKKAIKGHGIGTDATRASIIETLYKRGYVKSEKKHIIPTELGQKFIETVNIPELKSPELTADMEVNLSKIAAGELSKDVFMREAIDFIKKGIEKIKNSEKYNLDVAKKADDRIGKCPLCGKGDVLKNKAGWGCSLWKSGCKFFIASEIAGKKISEAQAKKIVSKGVSDFLKGFKSKSGKEFEARLRYNKAENKLVFEFKN